MMTTTINNAETARKVADKIVTLMISITEQKAAQERELNAVTAKYSAVTDTLKAELKDLQGALQKYLKKTANQAELFDDGNRSGHSSLATFGYRASAPALKAMQGTLADVAARLLADGKREYLTIEEPRVSINIPAIKAANLGPGALADLGLRWETKTNFFIEPTNGVITRASIATA
ncbi:MAG: host-nuclease inhibitor Gam family protein [Akkermansia sp.]